ncbi:MAG: transposase [Leptospiraceae bacterium]|nr:transposase [Leptospiraceae bacterium]
MTLFQNKYRIESTRREGWDYADNGYYFITICAKDREHFFGEIENGEMVLSEMGLIAKNIWSEVPKHFPHAELDEFIVMPNHVHGLLYLSGQEKSKAIESEISRPNKTRLEMETRSIASLQQGGITGKNNPVLNPLSLSKIIRWYKGRVTFEISRRDAIHRVSNNTEESNNNDMNANINQLISLSRNFQWQPRFHDRIVRDEKELYNVRNYITNNPRNWEDDEFYT